MSLKITGSFQPNYAGVFNVLDNINFCNIMSGLNADETYSVVEKEKIILRNERHLFYYLHYTILYLCINLIIIYYL